MVHISDLSWTKRYAHPSEFTKAWQPAGSSGTRHRQRKASNQPWSQANPGKSMGCIRQRIPRWFLPRGYSVEARRQRRNLPNAARPRSVRSCQTHPQRRRQHARYLAKPLTVKVIEFNKEDRRILVSHTRYLEDLKYKAEAAVKAERVERRRRNARPPLSKYKRK
jgi:small subunit ribosomal protein S1